MKTPHEIFQDMGITLNDDEQVSMDTIEELTYTRGEEEEEENANE